MSMVSLLGCFTLLAEQNSFQVHQLEGRREDRGRREGGTEGRREDRGREGGREGRGIKKFFHSN